MTSRIGVAGPLFDCHMVAVAARIFFEADVDAVEAATEFFREPARIDLLVKLVAAEFALEHFARRGDPALRERR